MKQQRPTYGDGTDADFHEEGYINVAPCVFGSAEEGLLPPPGGVKGLPMGTKLFSKKTCRADEAHHGQAHEHSASTCDPKGISDRLLVIAER